MSFKKFISGVSAFAIAASAFAGMAVTANAADYYSNNYEADGAAVDWTSTNAAGYLSIVEENGNHYLGYRNTASQNSRGAQIDLSKKDVPENYVVEFDAKVSPGNNQTSQLSVYKTGGAGNANDNVTNANAVVTLEATAANGTSWKINGDATNTVTLADSHGGTNTVDDGSDTWYHFIVAVSGTKAYLTINNADGTALYAQTAFTTGGNLGGIKFKAGRYWWDFGIDNVVVRDLTTADLPTTPQGDFSVVYKTEAGTTLTKTSSGSGDVDSAPMLSTADKAAFVEGGQKYIYVSDNAADVKIAADNSAVVTVTVRAAATYGYTVKSSIGTVISSGSAFEGDAVTAYYPRYILNEGTLYMAGPVNQQYQKSFTPDSDGYEYEITYADTQKENVVFHVEGEDIDGASVAETGYTNVRASQGKEGYGTDVSITTLPAGKYVITGATYANTSTTLSVKAGEDTVYSITGTGGWSESSGAEFVLKEETTLTFSGGSGNYGLDYIYIVKTGEYVPAPQGNFNVVYKTTDDVVLEKTSSGSGDENTNPRITAEDKADFTENGQKYIYVSDNSAEVNIVADSTVDVTVTVRAAAAYTVTVNGSDGTNIDTISVFEGDKTNYSYPKYTTDDNNAVKSVADETTFTKEVAPTEDTTITIPYTAYEGTAYFVDHEKITDTAALGSGNYSNGSASRAVNDGVEAFTIASAGTYDITVAASCRNTYNSSVFAVYKNSVADENLIFTDDVKGTSQNNVQTDGIKTVTDVELAEGDIIIIQGDYGQTWIDYVLAVQTAAAAPQVQTVKILIGDVSGDGKINVLDLTQLGRKVKGQTTNIGKVGQEKTKVDDTKIFIGDVSGDSKINVLDLTQLGRKVKGQTTNIGNVGQEKTKVDDTKIFVGDVSGDSKINVLDLTQLGRKVKGQTTNIGNVGQEVEVIDESSAK